MRFLRGLAGHVLPCGCLVGVYETYNCGVVASIDAVGPACSERDHRLHAIVPTAPAAETRAAAAASESSL